MKRFSVRIEIKLKPVVLDPQGKAVLNALGGLGFEEVLDARVGKIVELTMDGESAEDIRHKAGEMCRRLLSNPVIEDSVIEVAEKQDA
ncbi:MAG: phosphoribosylformylglycinamidine synthase subunit PurS [Candidatus Dadabacteria bacterium]|nr:phosphoribosylformylglycinamidine synthase subunit PurS [Candidatus Dadabacteria bacterium]MCY4261813.1 phosphoribosylformylglycinamidine synthase subunit PurS [Candidatus Dadabacteria bacterium]